MHVNRTIRTLLTLIVGVALLAACGTPRPPTVDRELTVVVAGTGTGTVTSSPAGIDTTDGDLVADFTDGTVVTLTATPADGSTFAGFSFPAAATYECEDGSTATTCVLTMDAAKSVTATFQSAAAPSAELVVSVVAGGASAGSVASSPAGIDTTDGTTEATFDVGTEVTLTASVTTPHFAGWTGGQCDGVKALTCTFTVTTVQPEITANFNVASTVNVTISAQSDTAEEFLADSFNASNINDRWPRGHTYTFSDDLELGYDPQHGPQAIGVRFPGVAIPANAIILDASIAFTAFQNGPGGTGTATAAALTIVGQASATAGTFVGDPNPPEGPNPGGFDVTTRTPATTASAAWSVAGDDFANGATITTPALGPIVQEIVNLSGWASGGGLVFVIEPVDSTSTSFARVHASGTAENAGNEPTLTVQFVGLP